MPGTAYGAQGWGSDVRLALGGVGRPTRSAASVPARLPSLAEICSESPSGALPAASPPSEPAV